jgi:L-ascorbate metabolism protein UlaG (beta-lactamase superfamily)
MSMAARNGKRNPYYEGPVSDHFDGTAFFNPGGTPPKGFLDLLKWQIREKRTRWPRSWQSPHAGTKPPGRVRDNDLAVTMVGHATLLIQIAGLNLLTDPLWSERTSPVSFAGPKRVARPGIALEDLPPIDAVLLTHNHYDHLDVATLRALHQIHDPLVVTPLGNDTIVRQHVPDMRIETGDWGDTVSLPDGTAIHFEPCHHWSARGSSDRRMALWAAFVIESAAGKIYHIGDTGFHEGINDRKALDKHGPFRLAILPIGAYEPRWFMKDQHQDPHEAVRGMQLCGARYAVGHHWGTVQLTNEGHHDPVHALAEALDRHGIGRDRFRALQPGESWLVPEGDE